MLCPPLPERELHYSGSTPLEGRAFLRAQQCMHLLPYAFSSPQIASCHFIATSDEETDTGLQIIGGKHTE